MKRVHQQGRRPKGQDQEMPGKANPPEREAEPAANLNVNRGQQDGDAGVPLQHVIQKAVARVIVVLLISTKLFLFEQAAIDGADDHLRAAPGCPGRRQAHLGS